MGSNPFETGDRKIIPAVLIYPFVSGSEGERTLMLHRNGREGDYHEGKWNGLGGKLEQDESPLQAARRELLEESGLDLEAAQFIPLGVIQFPCFKAHKNEDWVVWVYAAKVAPAQVKNVWPRGPEGDLHWVPTSELLSLNLWAGDRHFIPYVIARKPFQATIWYRGEEVTQFEISALLA